MADQAIMAECAAACSSGAAETGAKIAQDPQYSSLTAQAAHRAANASMMVIWTHQASKVI